MPLLIAILAGLVLGQLSGGSIQRLREAELTFPSYLIVIFVVQGLARGRLGAPEWEGWGLLVWAVASIAIILAITLSHPHPSELMIVAAGVGANLLVVLANGFMPVVPAQGAIETPVGQGAGFYALADANAVLAPLADVLVLPIFGATYFLSLGDVLLGAGAAAVLMRLMTGVAGPQEGDKRVV